MNSDESEIRIKSGTVCVAGGGVYSVAHGNSAFVEEAFTRPRLAVWLPVRDSGPGERIRQHVEMRREVVGRGE